MYPFNLVIPVFRKIWKLIRTYKKSSFIAIASVLLIGTAVYFLLQPSEPVVVVELAERGDLRQTVELNGEIVSDRDLKLQFPITGIIEKVSVKEGDKVRKGQLLATLRSSGLNADINSAAASVAQAKADLQNIQEGSRPEEITIAKSAVANRKAALASAQESVYAASRTLLQAQEKLRTVESETQVNIQGSVDTVRSTVSSALAQLSTSTLSLRGILSDTAVADVYVKNEASTYNAFELSISDLNSSIERAQSEFRTIKDYTAAISALQNMRSLAENTSLLFDRVYNSVSFLPENPYFTIAKRESVKSSIASQRTIVQGSLTSLDTSLQTLRNTPASIDTRIAAEKANVLSAENAKRRAEIDLENYKTAVQSEEANLALKLAGSRPGDIAAAKARLNQAYASLARAQDRYNDTVIRAPIDGVITKVNLKEGELLSTSFESESPITMLGDAPYRIETYVPEIDVPKLQMSQSGTIILDAFSDKEFAVRVTEVNPTSSVIDGVNKYRVMLDFVDPVDVNLVRIGMTGDVTIVTNQVRDVIYIPARAVRRNDEGFEVVDVQNAEGIITPVSVATGMEGEGGNIEVISGITEAQRIVVLQK